MADFIALIKAVDGGNAADTIERLAALAEDPPASAAETAARMRHLEALAFRLDSGGRPVLAARVYDIAARSAPEPGRWSLAAAEARLRGLCEERRFAEAATTIARLQQADADQLRPKVVATLIDRTWDAEFRGDTEACVQCYRIALTLAGADATPRSPDGDPLPIKIKNLRRLQLDALVDDGCFDAAAVLHDTTRHIIGAGPLAALDIVSLRQLADVGAATYTELRPERPITPPALKFVGPTPALTSEPGDLAAPPFYLALVENCRAFPRSNLVVKDTYLAYDLAAHPRRRDSLLQDGVNTDQFMMAAFGARRALVEEPEDVLSVEAGLSLFGLQSRNYGHWFCEFVPRMLAYNDPRCPEGIPLCIDDHMPPTHEEIVALLDVRGRPIIKLPPRAVEFGLLGLAPVPAFFPFEMKPGRQVYDTVWPADILADLRNLILQRAAERGALSGRTGRRLFISRKAFAQRQLVNEIEIAEALRPYGFEVITPETITFLEQVDAFHAAEIIVGSSSSALTNGLFCRPGCRILGLIHANLGFNFRGYTSFIEACGSQITFLRGQTTSEDGHAFHASYHVAPSAVVAALEHLRLPASIPAPPPPHAARSVVGQLLGALPFTRRTDRG